MDIVAEISNDYLDNAPLEAWPVWRGLFAACKESWKVWKTACDKEWLRPVLEVVDLHLLGAASNYMRIFLTSSVPLSESKKHTKSLDVASFGFEVKSSPGFAEQRDPEMYFSF